ncbi:zinc finger protein 41-like [Mesocricetus auratus]|uniref:Zinc finger protein 41-like n=1 Tax=Mesocricetus auratus TaxID=10036 RepID=A0ABM2W7Q1_MESAU|nr:zinc finger protein 41-like [Mesocricetus auratus]
MAFAHGRGWSPTGRRGSSKRTGNKRFRTSSRRAVNGRRVCVIIVTPAPWSPWLPWSHADAHAGVTRGRSRDRGVCAPAHWRPLKTAVRGSRSMGAVTYDDVHINFTQEEWALLNPSQKRLYKDVMHDTYSNLTATGYSLEDHYIEEHCQSSRRCRRMQ